MPTIASSAAFGPPGANTTSTSAGNEKGLPSNTTVAESPDSATNSATRSVNSWMAPRRSRHHPFGREPMTFMPSINHRLVDISIKSPLSSIPSPTSRARRDQRALRRSRRGRCSPTGSKAFTAPRSECPGETNCVRPRSSSARATRSSAGLADGLASAVSSGRRDFTSIPIKDPREPVVLPQGPDHALGEEQEDNQKEPSGDRDVQLRRAELHYGELVESHQEHGP
jgi:hypothetical protein